MIDKKSIEKILIDKKIPKMEFYNNIGMTPTGYTQMWEKDTMKVSTLRKIATILEIPLSEFLEDKPSKNTLNEPDMPYGKGLQAKLIECMEKKEALYERLVASEEEKLRLVREAKGGPAE